MLYLGSNLHNSISVTVRTYMGVSHTVITSLWLFHTMGTPPLEFHFALNDRFMHLCAETPGDAWLPMAERHSLPLDLCEITPTSPKYPR